MSIEVFELLQEYNVLGCCPINIHREVGKGWKFRLINETSEHIKHIEEIDFDVTSISY